MEIGRNRRTEQTAPTLSMDNSDATSRHTLAVSCNEKDLGVHISNNLKFDVHINSSVTQANRKMGQLKRSFKYWTPKTFNKLYSAYIRPNLEYAVQAWSPYLKKDKLKIEKVQRRATKLVPSLKNLSYQDRLARLKLTTLEDRRIRGDLIQFFKFYSNINIINWQKGPVSATGSIGRLRTSTHSMVRQDIPNCSQREHFFLNRVIPRWNALPEDVVASKTVNHFKIRYDSHFTNIHPSYNAEVTRLRNIKP